MVGGTGRRTRTAVASRTAWNVLHPSFGPRVPDAGPHLPRLEPSRLIWRRRVTRADIHLGDSVEMLGAWNGDSGVYIVGTGQCSLTV